jgi:hypothetical protein
VRKDGRSTGARSSGRRQTPMIIRLPLQIVWIDLLWWSVA